VNEAKSAEALMSRVASARSRRSTALDVSPGQQDVVCKTSDIADVVFFQFFNTISWRSLERRWKFLLNIVMQQVHWLVGGAGSRNLRERARCLGMTIASNS
jgi:hypothetical protein